MHSRATDCGLKGYNHSLERIGEQLVIQQKRVPSLTDMLE